MKQQQQQQQHEIRFVNKVKNDIDVDRDTFQIFKTMKSSENFAVRVISMVE